MPALILAAVLLAAAAFFAPVAKRLGLSSIVGYLVAGLAIGPSGFALVYSEDQVDEILHLAEFGVVLLLFLIGLELRPARLLSMRTDILGAGGLQVIVTALVLGLLACAFGLGLMEAGVLGASLAFSSTAFVLQFLGEKGLLTQRYGRLGFSILLFQDLAVIPLIVIITLLAPAEMSRGGGTTGDPLTDIPLAIATIGLVLFLGRYVLRYVYGFVAATGVSEGMTAAALLTVVSVALLMDYAGLSSALGAFLAGVLIGGSQYRHEIKAQIAPFERMLLGIFFTAVGMALDVRLLFEEPGRIFGLAVGLMAAKAAVLFVIGRWRGLTAKAATYLAISLSQGGEFAFVLFALAAQGALLDPTLASELGVAVTVSIALTPLFFFLADRLLPGQKTVQATPEDMPDGDGHVIVAGFGPFGQIPARILSARKIPFTALDNSSEHVDFVRRFGAQVYYGDPARPELLEAADTDHARALILALEDPDHARAVAETVRRLYPNLPIYARARDRLHAYELLDLGVTVVERETYHSALALSEEVLVGLGDTRSAARDAIALFRSNDQQRFDADYPHYRDTARIAENARRAAEELERQFEKDFEAGGGEPKAS